MTGTRKKSAPTFITKTELAHELGPVATETIDSWIAAGTFPPPHSRPGGRTSVWLRAHFEAYVRDRRWPDAAYPS